MEELIRESGDTKLPKRKKENKPKERGVLTDSFFLCMIGEVTTHDTE